MTREELHQFYSQQFTEPPNFYNKRQELGDEEYVWWCLAGSYNLIGCEHWWDKNKEYWNTQREAVIQLAERHVKI